MRYAWSNHSCGWCSEGIREADPYKHWPDDVPDDIPIPDGSDEMYYHPDCFHEVIEEERNEESKRNRS